MRRQPDEIIASGVPKENVIYIDLDKRGFYYAENTDNRVNYGPTLENMLYIYACSQDCTVSVGRIGKLECDFIIRNSEMNYSYVQVAYTIALSKETED